MQDLSYKSISELSDLMSRGKATSRDIVISCLNRVAAADSCEGGFNSVLELNPDALFIAESLDGMREESGVLGPLHGIPVLVKDNISTADKMVTSAGSVSLRDNFAPYDAHIVSLLREAGAVILGKANMTEFANYMSKDGMPGGYSSRGGQVICPPCPGENPGGSSSGSGAALAAGICPITIGTETCGSIMKPAMRNGVVGIKPTIGLVGRTGIIPISNTLDTAGPMARNVRDAATLLGALTATDPDDPSTWGNDRARVTDYTEGLDVASLSGARIGINRLAEADGEELAVFEELLVKLEAAGAVLIEGADMESILDMRPILRYEFRRGINSYLAGMDKTAMGSLKDIIAYNQEHADIALRFGQNVLIDCEFNTTGRSVEPEYIEAMMVREREIGKLGDIFERMELDAILCLGYSTIAPYTGFPSISVPIGRKRSGLPIGSYWVGRKFDEKRLIEICHVAEREAGIDIRP